MTNFLNGVIIVVAINKVLIVDDDENVLEILNMSLEDFTDWSITAVGSGDEAVSRAAEEKPDVILLDVMMPGMDGPMTLVKLREQESTANIPVIFMTAKAQSEEIQSFLELGAAGVIIKPFDPVTLGDEIVAALATAR